jgi:hypothetical protein
MMTGETPFADPTPLAAERFGSTRGSSLPIGVATGGLILSIS